MGTGSTEGVIPNNGSWGYTVQTPETFNQSTLAPATIPGFTSTADDLTADNAAYGALANQLRDLYQPVCSGWLAPTKGESNGTVYGGTFRNVHKAWVDITELVIGFCNIKSSNGEVVGSNDIAAVALGVEYPSGATPIQATFNGAFQPALKAGAWVWSDPIPVDIPAGSTFYTRSFVSIDASTSQKYPRGIQSLTSTGGQTNRTSSPGPVDLTAVATAMTAAQELMWGPAMIVGKARTLPSRRLAVVGDSIPSGRGDTPDDSYGWVLRAINDTIPYMRFTCDGEKVQNFVSLVNRRRVVKSQLCTDMLCTFGRNDYNGGRTLAQIQADLISCWNWGVRQGFQTIRQTTLTPSPSSTDNWTTTANQTPNAGETVRANLNNWLRDGAPILAGVAVATGSNAGGTLRAGASGHPLTGYLELADLVESARDSGKYKVYTNHNVSAAAIASNVATITTADAHGLSVSDSVGVAGVSATFNGVFTVTVVGSPTTFSYAKTAADTTVGAGGTCALVETVDGTHPSKAGHVDASACMNVASLYT